MAISNRRAEARWIEREARWVLEVQHDGARKKFTSSTAGRRGKREVESRADEWLEQGRADMRFELAWTQYLEYCKVNKSTDHFLMIRSAGEHHIKPIVGGYKLSAITPAMWQRVLDASAQKGLSRATVSNIRGFCIAFTKYARRSRWDLERIEPGDLVIPRVLPPVPEHQALTENEIKTLFTDDTVTVYGSHSEHEWWIYAFRFAVATGLRRGELLALRTEDIRDGVVSIRASDNGHRELTPGKNANARRRFMLNNTARVVLDEQRQYLMEVGVVSPWVFPDRRGMLAHPAGLAKAWRRYREQHGFNAGVTFHGLRHTFISLLKSDMPLAMLKSAVGHSAAMDTLGIYGHELDSDRQRAADISSGVFNRVLR